MTILFEKEVDDELNFDYEKRLEQVIRAAIAEEKCPYDCEINLTLTNNEGIRTLNQEFRGLDVPTDVLSFPMVDYEVPGDFFASGTAGSKKHVF